MKKLILLLAVIFNGTLYAQLNEAQYEAKMQLFEHHFNAKNFKGIFDLFSADMKAALPWEQTNLFLTNLNKQTGNIQKTELHGFVRETYGQFKTTFDYGVFAINISLNNQDEINGLLVEPFIESTDEKVLERNSIPLALPFNEEWSVVWGGDTREQNYHVDHKAQKHAFDILMVDENGNTHKGQGSKNEDYYVFGKELIAPCNAEVVMVVDGIPDNEPGDMNTNYVPGNTVVLKAAENEYLFFAHFKKGSIEVKEGDKVNQGDLLGLCGNSGNSSEPHLHFHIQNVMQMHQATGVKCYFERILVDGEVKEDYSPVQGDNIQNQK